MQPTENDPAPMPATGTPNPNPPLPMPEEAEGLSYWIQMHGELVSPDVIAGTFFAKGPEWMWRHRLLLQQQAEYIASL